MDEDPEMMLDLKDPLMDVGEVCEALKISRSTLYARMDSDPSFPRPKKIGNRSVWYSSELDDWLDKQPRG